MWMVVFFRREYTIVLARKYKDDGKFDAAREVLVNVLEDDEASLDWADRACLLYWLGDVNRAAGDMSSAEHCYKEALSLVRLHDNPLGRRWL